MHQDYETRRQLRAVTSHSKRHSSTITAIFPAPFDLPSKKEHRKRPHHVRKGDRTLENMSISIDLDVKDVPASDDLLNKLRDLVGLSRVEKDFELLVTGEKIIRAFAKAKFKNVNLIRLDGEVIYNDPDDFFDSDEAIDTIVEHIKEHGKGGNLIHMYLSSEEHPCTVDVQVSRVHLPFTHDILITIDGELKDEYFRRIINYLEENLEIEDIDKEWSRADD